MLQRNSLAALSVAVFGLILLGLGAWALAQEGRTYILHAATPLTSIALRTQDDPTGMGITTRYDVLQECDSTLRSAKSFELMLLENVKFEDLRLKCAHIAETITQNAPTFSLAYAIAAKAAAAGGDWAKMNEQLQSSQRTGPNEQWIGRIRFEVADTNVDRLDDAGRSLYDKDLAMLIRSNKGVPYIARQYVVNDGFRSRITSVLEQMSEADQRRYISILRRMVPR